MNREAITIAGERFVDLDAALDRVEVLVEASGYVTLRGYLPEDHRRCLERALIVIEAEFLAHGHDPCREREWDPVRRLIAMMGEAKNGRR